MASLGPQREGAVGEQQQADSTASVPASVGVGASCVGRKKLAGVSRAALNALHLGTKSPNRSSSMTSPATADKTDTGGNPLGNVTGSFYGLSASATTALRGVTSGLGGVVGSGTWSGTGSEVGLAIRPSIRKGYLLMLRGTCGSGGTSTDASESGELDESGARAVAGTEASGWSERFFYLSGHFLRYKKHSRNLTSVNLKQTDHVEFNLQSAVVDALDEADMEWNGTLRPRRRHAFRLISTVDECQHSDAAPSDKWAARARSAPARVPGVGTNAFPAKVWTLAATGEKERAMWMQAIREAISLGQELLSPGEAGREAGSLSALAARMSEELEVRDRHHRLRVYRSCFIGEDAVSWLQSECGPCSVEESLSMGNKMIAAGLIYHCTYGHGLQNSRLFYKFADSVYKKSDQRRRSVAQGPYDGPKHVAPGGVQGVPPAPGFPRSSGAVGTPNSEEEADREGSRDVVHSSLDAWGDHDYAHGVEGGAESDAESGTSASVVSGDGILGGPGMVGGGIVGRDQGAGRGGGSGNGRGAGNGGGHAIALAAPKGGLAREESGGSHQGFDAVSGNSSGSVRRMASEIEELKLACAELERCQSRMERQAQACAEGLATCLEKFASRALASTVIISSIPALCICLLQCSTTTTWPMDYPLPRGNFEEKGVRSSRARGPPQTEWLTQALLVLLVAFAVHACLSGRDAVREAAGFVLQSVRPSEGPATASSDSGVRHGTRVTHEDKPSVPLLHAGQFAEIKNLLLSAPRQRATSHADGEDGRCMPGAMLIRAVSERSGPASVPREKQGGKELAGGSLGQDGRLVASHGGQARDGDSSGLGGQDAPAAAVAGCGDYGLVGDGDARESLDTVDGVDSLPPETAWPHHPLFVRLSPSAPGQVRLDGHAPDSSIPVNTDDIAVPFETPLFKGRLLVRVKGLAPSGPDQDDGAEAYFRGKRRLMQSAVQGCFKKELPFDRVYTGQAYSKPFTHLPAKWLIRSAFALIRKLSPALREDITGDRPYMVSPLAATAQAIRAEEPGDECAIVGDLAEETGMLGGSFMDGVVPASARKKFFSNPRNLKAYAFKPGVVYTFDFYQHLYNAVTFEIDLGFRKVKLADYLNHQPAQIMALDFETKEMLWNVEVWHTALLKVREQVNAGR